MASARRSSGPVTAIQESFICGRPQILEMPLRVKVSSLWLEAKVWGGWPGGEPRRESRQLRRR